MDGGPGATSTRCVTPMYPGARACRRATAHPPTVLAAAAEGPLSNEQIRAATGLDAAGARAVALHLVAYGRLVTAGQRRGMRYLLPGVRAEPAAPTSVRCDGEYAIRDGGQ